MSPHVPGMTIDEYLDWDDLPDTGPALLRYSPFEPLFPSIYWVPISNRKILCCKATDQNGIERLIHSHAPYRDLVQRWLEEALAYGGRTWATPDEINTSFADAPQSQEQPE